MEKWMVIDWMDGSHLEFENYDEALSEYVNRANQTEADVYLLKIENSFCNLNS